MSQDPPSNTVQPQASEADLFRMFNEIGIVNQLSATRFERNLSDGLTLSQFSVLNNFVRLGGTRSPKQLADAFQVTKGAMTNTLGKLAHKGFVTISPNPDDARAKVVAITASGQQARARAIAAAGDSFSDVVGLLSVAEVAQLIELLTRIRAHLDQHREL
ncbi:MAG: MarR family transcriptional regulator [Pseudomonadota bacterium]